MNWITMTTKSGKHFRTETLDSSFDHIRSHQQCIQWSPLLEIEPATTGCWAKTLLLSQESISNRSCRVVAGSISSGGDHGIHCRCPVFLYVVRKCSLDFLVSTNSIHKIIPLLIKEKCRFLPVCQPRRNLLVITEVGMTTFLLGYPGLLSVF